MVVGEISASHSGASHAALFLLSPLLSLLPRNITLPSVFHFFLHISLVNSTNFFFFVLNHLLFSTYIRFLAITRMLHACLADDPFKNNHKWIVYALLVHSEVLSIRNN